MLFDVDKNKYVLQIDSTDRLINKIPKIEAHLKGIRHKAFSVLIFNNDGKMLIQKRSIILADYGLMRVVVIKLCICLLLWLHIPHPTAKPMVIIQAPVSAIL